MKSEMIDRRKSIGEASLAGGDFPTMLGAGPAGAQRRMVLNGLDRHGELLDPEARRRVVREHLPDADVLGQSLRGLVPGLAHDVALVGAVHRCLRRAAGAQRVPAQGLCLHPRAPCSPLQNPADRRAMDAARGEIAVTIDGAKDGPRFDMRFLQPPAQRTDRTRRRVLPERNTDLPAACLLIRLRAAQIDDQSVPAERDIGEIDGRELGAAKRAREAGQDQRAIARTGEILRVMRDDPANVGRE